MSDFSFCSNNVIKSDSFVLCNDSTLSNISLLKMTQFSVFVHWSSSYFADGILMTSNQNWYKHLL